MGVFEYVAQWNMTVPIPLSQALEEAEAGEYYIMRQPESVEISDYGETVTFLCEANDSQATYEWYYSDDGETWETAGSTSKELSVTVTQEIIDRQYMCIATFQDDETGTSNPAQASLGE